MHGYLLIFLAEFSRLKDEIPDMSKKAAAPSTDKKTPTKTSPTEEKAKVKIHDCKISLMFRC